MKKKKPTFREFVQAMYPDVKLTHYQKLIMKKIDSGANIVYHPKGMSEFNALHRQYVKKLRKAK